MRLALSNRERADLDRLEAKIEQGRETFREVGEALLEIRRRRLYRSTHRTFEVYCRERWGFTDRRGRQLMRAAVVARASGTMVPLNERQARELDQVPEPQRDALLEQLRATGRATAKQIRAARDLLATLKPAQKLARAQAAETAALRSVARLDMRDRLAKIDRLAGRLRKAHGPLTVARRADALLDRYLAVIHSAG